LICPLFIIVKNNIAILFVFLPPKHILQILPDVLLPQSGEVSIDIPRCHDIRMPQPLLDVFQLPSVVVENARRTVTDIVETHLGQSMLCENLLECAGDVIRAVGLAVTPTQKGRFHVLFYITHYLLTVVRAALREACRRMESARALPLLQPSDSHRCPST